MTLGSSTYVSLLFSFLVFTKCHVLNLRVGRSHDQVLQSTYSSARLDCHDSSTMGLPVARILVFTLKFPVVLERATRSPEQNSLQIVFHSFRHKCPDKRTGSQFKHSYIQFTILQRAARHKPGTNQGKVVSTWNDRFVLHGNHVVLPSQDPVMDICQAN